MKKRRPKPTEVQAAQEEQRTTSIGICHLAKSYLSSAEFLLKAQHCGELSLRNNSPAIFLLTHGIELVFKAWLRRNGKTLDELIKIGHNLTEAYRQSKSYQLPVDEDSLLLEWASTRPELHLTDEAVISELDRLHTIPQNIRKVLLQRELILLGRLHGGRFVLRYHRSDMYKYPNIDLALYAAQRFCTAIEHSCEQHYNDTRRRT